MKERTCGNCKHWHAVSSVHLMYVEHIYDNWTDHGACDVYQVRQNRQADAALCPAFEKRPPLKRRTKLSGRIPPME